MPPLSLMCCSLILLTSVVGAADPTRVLFIGNSFTFVNDLPHQLVNIAASLGKTVVVANSTVGGCTMFAQRPDGEAADGKRTAALLEEEWDFIVLQSYSILPSIEKARSTYLEPGIASFSSMKKPNAKLVLYLTWGYRSGATTSCPTSGSAACFPRGSNAELTAPPCNESDAYAKKVNSFECMGYAIARGYADQLSPAAAGGVHLVAPCGVAWQTVRGATPTPAGCKAAIDAEYAAPSPFSAANNLSLPLRVDGLPEDLASFELYRKLKGGKWDKHPNMAGQYLNALVFYATLFGESPVGAAGPLDTGKAPKLPLSADILGGLQRVAASVVLDHAEHWRQQ